MNQWITDNLPTVVALAAMLGGLVAHMRAYEKSEVKFTIHQHIAGVVLKTVYALFTATLVYFLAIGFAWQTWTICVVAAIGGLHGAELLDFTLTAVKDIITKWAGRQGGGDK